MGWDAVAAKFDRLAERHVEASLRTRIRDVIANLDELPVQQLTNLLAVPLISA